MTICIFVLKFVNKGVFLEGIREFAFSLKRGTLVFTSANLEKKGVIFMSIT